MKELIAIVRALNTTDIPSSTLATLVSVDGSSYRRPGARLLVLPGGERIGSISGGCLEEDVVTRAARVASTGQAEVIVYDTTSENDLVWGVGLGCHGIVRVVIERLPLRPAWVVEADRRLALRQPITLAVAHETADSRLLGTSVVPHGSASSPSCYVQQIDPPTKLAIFGAGDDARPLVRVAKELGWTVGVFDPRPAFATPGRFPGADEVAVGPVDTLFQRAALDRYSVAVVMTHHYIYDVPLIRDLIHAPVPYVGLLGPRKRAEKILSDIAAEGVLASPADRARLHAPVGLDLGADGPEQVALAIVAEIQATLNGHDARPLRHRTRPIHDHDPAPAVLSPAAPR